MDEFPGDDEPDDEFEPDDNWEPPDDWQDNFDPDPDFDEHASEMYELARSEPSGWWLPHDFQTAFHWRPVGDSNFEIDGMILHGEITAERLHGIRLTGLQGPGWNTIATEYKSSFPPNEDRLQAYFREYSEAEGLVVIVEWEPRQPGETPDHFYQRVGKVYGDLQLTNLGNTTTMLAELAEVPFSTAVHWVREARKRGHLDLSRRQRTIRGEQ